MTLKNVYKIISRKKPYTPTLLTTSALSRTLKTLDLAGLGISSTLSVGIYMLTGIVAKEHAGPAAVLSFLIAAFVALLAGTCYAEFAIRIPRAGQVYNYAYVTVGEMVAFVIGWDAALEYSIGAASMARGVSSYIDASTNETMKWFSTEYMPLITFGYTAPYFDLLAFAVVLFSSLAILLGTSTSAVLAKMFALTNVAVIIFIVIRGSYDASTSNWSIKKTDLPKDHDYGEGGFLPYGFNGVLRGVSICFYGLIGHDVITSAGEETQKPSVSMPRAIFLSLGITALLLMLVSAMMTIMVPYYSLNIHAPWQHLFAQRGEQKSAIFITIAAAFLLCGAVVGSLFSLSRIVYAMALDGLVFHFLSLVGKRYQTPVYTTVLFGLLTALIAGLFSITQLMHLLSIGTLMAYTTVAACVLLLRYEVDNFEPTDPTTSPRSSLETSYIFNIRGTPTKRTSQIVGILTPLYAFGCIGMTVIIVRFQHLLEDADAPAVSMLVLIFLFTFVALLVISRQPQSIVKLPFMVPLVPWLPGLSIFLNIFLMMQFDEATFVRVVVWFFLGIIIYISYGVWHSNERIRVPVTRKPTGVLS